MLPEERNDDVLWRGSHLMAGQEVFAAEEVSVRVESEAVASGRRSRRRLPRPPSLSSSSFLVGSLSTASAGDGVMWPVSAWAAFASWRPSAAAAAMVGELAAGQGRPAGDVAIFIVIFS